MLLQATPHNEASEFALKVYEQVLLRVRADRLVQQTVQVVGGEMFVQGQRIDLDDFSSVVVCGAGKAAVPMAKALQELLGSRISSGLLVTKEAEERLPGLEIIEGGHPVPTPASLEAGKRMLDLAQNCREDQLVIFVLSGGASALLELPIEGLSLEDLAATNEILLKSGADIREVNAVRSRISRLKSGGLAKAFAPATVICLVLSDVVGNDLRAIGSGPLYGVGDLEEPSAGLASLLPEKVRRELRYPTLRREPPRVAHFVVGSISLAIHEAVDAAKSFGLLALPYADPLRGEARTMARKIVREAALQTIKQNAPFCIVFGGETTVTVRGSGLGGRCQEMAAAASWQISKLRDICFLAAGTDGKDGTSIAAGGFVDETTCERAANNGLSLRKALRENDSYSYLQASDGLIVTGPTDSNVNDLVLVVKT